MEMRHTPSGPRHATVIVAATACVLLAALACCAAPEKPVGPKLGEAASAIIDEANKVVGTGPPLSITETVPVPEGEEGVRQRYLNALRWLKTFFEAVNTLKKDMVKIRGALRAGVTEIRELRGLLQSLRETRAGTTDPEFAKWADETIAQYKAELGELEAEQDALLPATLARWDDLVASLDAKIESTSEFPEFQEGLKDLKKTIDQNHTLANMELYLSAGMNEEFDRLANKAQQDPALEMPVLLMRVTDYIDRGEGRSALYAARLGMQKYADQPAFRVYADSLEVSYLRMIATKAMGDGAEIHKRWNEYADGVSDNYIKQFFFGGLTRSLEWYAGKADALEELQALGHDRGVMEHNGIQVMLRLRNKGMTWDQIRGLSTEQLRDQMTELFGLTRPIGTEEAKGLSLSVRAAFRNNDVQRLFVQNKQQFDVDMGNSYYGADEFDQGFLEYAVDAVSAKNAILFFGPSAVLSSKIALRGGIFARTMSKIGVPGRIGKALSTESVAGTAVSDWVLARNSLQQVAGAIGQTRAGQALAKGMEKLRYLRYDAPGVVQVGTGVAEGLAQMALFEIGGRVGHTLGGDIGEFIGQAMVMLAGSPLARAQAEHQAMEATAAKMARTRAQWERMNGELKKIRLPVDNATKKLARGQTLIADDIAALDGAINRSKTLVDGIPAAADGALVRSAAAEAKALEGAAGALKAGEADASVLARNVAKSLQGDQTFAVKTLKESQSAVVQAARSGRTVKYGEPIRPATGTRRAELDAWPTPGSQTKVMDGGTVVAQRPPGGTPPPATTPPRKPYTASSAEQLADDALRANNFSAAQKHYTSSVDRRLRQLRDLRARKAAPGATQAELDELAKQQKEALDALTRSYDRMKKAEQALRHEANMASRVKSHPREMKRLADQADEALQPFSRVQRKDLHLLDMNNVARMERMNIGSAGSPYWVKDAAGNRIGVWKPAAHPNGSGMQGMDAEGQMFAEVFFSRLGRQVGARIPHAEPMIVAEYDAAGNIIAQHQGVISRYVPGARQLASLSPGARAALKSQIAELRAVSTYIGNYDVHFGNYVIDKAGRVWAIDAGLAVIKTPGSGAGLAVDQHLIIAKHLRGNMPGRNQGVAEVDDLITHSEMSRMADRIRELPDNKLKEIVDDVMPGHPDAAGVLETHQVRRDNLDDLLDRWPAPSSGTPGPQTWLFPLPQAAPEPGMRWLQAAA